MSGGKGGKSKTPSMQQQLEMQKQAIEMSRPSDIALKTTGYGGMGYNMPANPMAMGTPETGMGVTPPGWAKGDWEMPWWGKQAPNVGAAMLQQQGWGQYGPGGQAGAGGGGQAGGGAYGGGGATNATPGGATGAKAGLGAGDWMPYSAEAGMIPPNQRSGAQAWGDQSLSQKYADLFARAQAQNAAAPQGGTVNMGADPFMQMIQKLFNKG